MLFNTTFNNISVISWQSVLLVEEIRVLGENKWPVTSHFITYCIECTSSDQDNIRCVFISSNRCNKIVQAFLSVKITNSIVADVLKNYDFEFYGYHHFAELLCIEVNKNCIIQLHTICSSFLVLIPNNIC
jgi:hypothetical protein